MSLMEKLTKSGSIRAVTLSESNLFNEKDLIPTSVPIINVALSGKLDGGLSAGLTVLAGPSKHFKSLMGLIMVQAYMKQYPDSVCLFYDSEFGVTPEYINAQGIDPSRIIHIPIEHIEQLKFDISKRLETIERGDKVIIFIDSVGNLASKKEVEDALDEKSVADMSRAKALKSLFRIITPHLTTKDLPCITIAHTYKTMELYSKDVVSGGCMAPETKIHTLNGLKEIKSIERGDIVLTLDGEKMVTHTWTPDTLADGNPECYEIEFEDGYTCTVSDNHPFLTKDGWIYASELVEGCEVLKLINTSVPKQENCGGIIVKKITKVGKKKVYDISVADNHHYILENGVICHNTGLYYAANTIFIVGRSQEKDADGIQGYNFTINIEKSRFVKEKSKCTFQVLFDKGISRWSGLMDIGIELGYTFKPKNGWYSRINDDKNYRFADTENKDFWLPILTNKDFQEAVKSRYQLGTVKMFDESDYDESGK